MMRANFKINIVDLGHLRFKYGAVLLTWRKHFKQTQARTLKAVCFHLFLIR